MCDSAAERFDDVAVLVPCHNEELTVGKVVQGFLQELPGATVYVYDNCSTDQTAEAAGRAGAVVRYFGRKGKGAVIRQMFRDVEQDRMLMVDGDGTYPPEYARVLLHRLVCHDMVIGDRLSYNYFDDNVRPMHGFGNRLVRFLVNRLFHGEIRDVMTGYRAFTKEFVKSVELSCDGFETETEMTIWALSHGSRISTVPIMYLDRPEGSRSKLHTVRDGIRVLWLIIRKKWGQMV